MHCKVVFFALLVVACAAEERKLVGGAEDIDVDDPEMKRTLPAVVAKQNANIEIVKIISAKKQVVAGKKYIVEFQARTANSDKLDTYCVSYVLQEWISKEPQYVEFNIKS